MEFRVLGSLEVLDGACEITPSAAKVRAVLAMLVLRHNQIVSTREFIDELWGERPPPSALSTLHTYVYKLRKTLGRGGAATLATKPYGYLLQVDPAAVDLHEFERRVAEGRRLLDQGDAERASRALVGALGLWRGPALANVVPGELLSAQITRLEESRLRALELRIEADLRLGRHRELISELKELTLIHPLNEEFHAKLMAALHACGRRVEALEVFQSLRRRLVDQLGLEPSPELRRLQQRLLAADDAEPLPAEPREETVTVVERSPAQLPPDIADFVGRAAEREWLAAALDRSPGTAVRVACLTGMPGVGKTALAVHAAHRARQAYPAGQLFARLTAPDGGPVDPGEVLGGFLRAAGVPDERIPADPGERSTMFRTWTAGRPALVVLDDACGAEQVQPLLPGSAECAVIVTSRYGLHGVAGARVLALDVPDEAECLELLALIIGEARVEQERREAERIVRLCGGLPLALRCAGSRLAASPGLALRVYADRLADPATRLDELCVSNLDVRAALDASYRRLDPPERSLFRLLGLLRTPDVAPSHAAALLGCETARAARLLARLADASLLRVRPGDDGEVRYTLHELVRLFARECLEEELDRARSAEPPLTSADTAEDAADDTEEEAEETVAVPLEGLQR